MKPRICVCCGEPISEKGNVLSRNPNLCASCSSLADGMGEAESPESPRAEGKHPPTVENPASVQKAA
jgi:hypothetical protein